jgi:hypothetical protein
MKDEQKQVGVKQLYRKPGLRAIELTAEEVLGIGCKSAQGGGPNSPSCAVRKCVKIGT